jgi:hypothetical protein
MDEEIKTQGLLLAPGCSVGRCRGGFTPSAQESDMPDKSLPIIDLARRLACGAG